MNRVEVVDIMILLKGVRNESNDIMDKKFHPNHMGIYGFDHRWAGYPSTYEFDGV